MQYLKHIKAFLIILAFLFGVITLLSLIIPSTVMSAKSIEVRGEKAFIYQQISDLREWKNWHPTFMQIDSADKQIKTTASSDLLSLQKNEGNIYSIKKVSADTANVHFEGLKNSDVARDIYYSVQQQEQSDTYTVEIKSVEHLRWYPWDKFRGLFHEQSQGPFLEMVLNSLKKYVETKPTTGN